MTTPIESHASILVKREDLFHPAFPSAKMRALIPYLTKLREEGFTSVVAPVGRHSLSPPAIVAAARWVGLHVRLFVNTTPETENGPLSYAKELGNPDITYKGRCRHWALRTSAAAWVASHAGSALLPTDCADPEFYGAYAGCVEELGPGPFTHVIPFLSGSFVAGIYMGIRRTFRSDDRIIAVPLQPEFSGENFLAKVLQAAWPERNQIKNTLPDNVIIAQTQRMQPTPWPSDSFTTHAAWAVAHRYRGWVPGRVLFWSLEQGYENKHLR